MDDSTPGFSRVSTAYGADVSSSAPEPTMCAKPGAWINLAQPPEVTTIEWQHLRFRVVALENLLIALMAEGPASRLDRARQMACHVAPRNGYTEHPVSLFAAAQIVHLVERARHMKNHPLF